MRLSRSVVAQFIRRVCLINQATTKTRDNIVRLCKKHLCGSYEWKVVSVSANISLECLKCHRRVLLQRRVFERRVKDFVSKSDWPS
jgi:hypothetical protein